MTKAKRVAIYVRVSKDEQTVLASTTTLALQRRQGPRFRPAVCP
jgi:hypothetical protein